MLPRRDVVHLREMLDTAAKAVEFARGRSRSDLDSDHQLRMALLWAVTEIGEASKQISEETRSSAEGIPWSDMAKSRDRMIHGYLTIDLDVVWDIVTRDLPEVAAGLERILGPGRGE